MPNNTRLSLGNKLLFLTSSPSSRHDGIVDPWSLGLQDSGGRQSWPPRISPTRVSRGSARTSSSRKRTYWTTLRCGTTLSAWVNCLLRATRLWASSASARRPPHDWREIWRVAATSLSKFLSARLAWEARCRRSCWPTSAWTEAPGYI